MRHVLSVRKRFGKTVYTFTGHELQISKLILPLYIGRMADRMGMGQIFASLYKNVEWLGTATCTYILIYIESQ